MKKKKLKQTNAQCPLSSVHCRINQPAPLNQCVQLQRHQYSTSTVRCRAVCERPFRPSWLGASRC